MKVLMLIILAIFSLQVSATSGRTNAEGCHNSKTEGYHCHVKKIEKKEK